MSFTYRYNGDLPTVFTTLRDANGTWVPNCGDTYESDVPIAHPLLELVTETAASEETAVTEVVTEPAVPDTTEQPVAVDEQEEN